MKKTCLKATASALAATVLAVSVPFAVFAEDTDDAFHVQYDLCTADSRSHTVYIDPADLENGDYTFQAAIYLLSDDEVPEDICAVSARWDGYDADGNSTRLVHFSNLSSMRETNDTLSRDYVLEDLNPDGSISTTSIYAKYVPNCFTTLAEKNGVLTTYATWCSLGSLYKTSYLCSTIYSAGPYKISFADKDGVSHTYDVTWDEASGTAVTVDTFDDFTSYGVPLHQVIHDYNPNIPEGEPLPNSCDSIIAYNLGQSTPTWFGGRSDAAPFVTFDVTVDADTPEGVYYVGFDNGSSDINNVINTRCTITYPDNLAPDAFDENGNILKQERTGDAVSRANDQDNWLQIVVGTPDTETTTEEQSAYDLNADGIVDVADASAVLSIYAASAAASDASAVSILQSSNIDADINGDGVVDIADATEILTYYAQTAAGLC
jgi:hypothetical protein